MTRFYILFTFIGMILFFQNCSNKFSINETGLSSSAIDSKSPTSGSDSSGPGAGSGTSPSNGNGSGSSVSVPQPAPVAVDSSVWPPPAKLSNSSACSWPLIGTRTFNVGPGQTYTELNNVPWLSMVAGDVVNIFYRAEPYRTKFGLRVQATKDKQFIINGVTNTNCERPTISGENAITADDSKASNFASDFQGDGLITIWRTSNDDNNTYKAKYITIQNLKLINANSSKKFYDNMGALVSWDNFGTAIYARRVSNLLIENCELFNNGQAVFTNSAGQNDNDYSQYIIVRRNIIYSNGVQGNDKIHGMYLQARRTLVEGNYLGRNIIGSQGFVVKDRSSGTVIRYNKIEASTRSLDFSETEEEWTQNLLTDPMYPSAWVYGNIMSVDCNNGGCREFFVNFGYDNNADRTRKYLNFYNNSVTSIANSNQTNHMAIVNVGEWTQIPIIKFTNNIIYHQGTSPYYLLNQFGAAKLTGVNYLPTNWRSTFYGDASKSGYGSVDNVGYTQIVGSNPNLSSALRPNIGSPVLDLSTAIPLDFVPSSDLSLANLEPKYEFNIEDFQAGATGIGLKIKNNLSVFDLGALESRENQ